MVQAPIPITYVEIQALLRAASHGNLASVQNFFTSAFSEISIQTKIFAFLEAADNGHLPIVQFVLNQLRQDLPARDIEVALWRAARGGHLNVVQFLLIHEGHHISAKEKQSAMMIALSTKHIEVAQAVFVTITAFSDYYPLMILRSAAELGQLNIVTGLLTRFRQQISSESIMLALDIAALNNQFDIIQVLLRHANPDILSDRGFMMRSLGRYLHREELQDLALIAQLGSITLTSGNHSKRRTALTNETEPLTDITAKTKMLKLS